MPDRPSTEPAALGPEAPARLSSTDRAAQAAPPTPTLDAPPPAAETGLEDARVPGEIASVPGATADWWAGVQE